MRFALNINNVLDDRDPLIYTFDGGWRDTNGQVIPNGFTLPDPITLRFSVRITF